jgi:T-complex protein 1 subunit delta
MSTPSAAAAPAKTAATQQSDQRGTNRDFTFGDKEKDKDVRMSNILAAKSVADTVRTSLGPKGMDKMIVTENDEVVITNDGATILKKLEVTHPAAKMLVELSKAQDIEAGDGTTSVVIVAGSLLNQTLNLLKKGIHATKISEGYKLSLDKAVEVLDSMAVPVTDREGLIKAAKTSLSSKVVYQNADILAPMAADAVLHLVDQKTAQNVDLNDIRVVKKSGGVLEDSKLVDGLVFNQSASKSAGGPTRIQNAKIGLIQFCISPPKPDMDNNVVVHNNEQIDRLLKEERKYVLDICNKIKKSGVNVLLIQKSILRDATTDMSLHFLAKMGIMVVQDVERKEVEFVAKTLNCKPVAHVDSLKPEKLGVADLVEEVDIGEGKIVKITGIHNAGKTVSVLLRGSNKLLLDETERSFHDALCVVRSLIKKKFVIAGGAAPETEVSYQLNKFAKTLQGSESNCVRAFADALEIIPTTLAENAGLKPINIVTELRNKHAQGQKNAGINVRKGMITDMLEENVIQPLLVTLSALTLATETVRLILKIDDLVEVR